MEANGEMGTPSIPVLLTLSSVSRGEDGQHEEPVRLITTGQLRPTATGYLLRYKENLPDEDGGAVIESDILLALQPGRITMTRRGEFGTSMVFVKDRRFEGAYHTPYGDMSMAVFATQVSTSLSEQRGSVHLEYQVDFQGSYASMNTLDLTYVAGEASAPPC